MRLAQVPAGVDIGEWAASHPKEIFQRCPVEGQYYILCPHVGHPTTTNGDYHSCQWLLSKNAWKPIMRKPVARRVWSTCRFDVLR